MSYDLNRSDTICALATPPGRSALAIVRVSGANAYTYRDKLFTAHRGVVKDYVATLGLLSTPDSGEHIDECLVTSFPEGRSYTGEALVEFSLHGNPNLVRILVRDLQSLGCRSAEPGEFTMRSVLTGKRDLLKAQAVYDLIEAESERALKVAASNLHGQPTNSIARARKAVISVLAEIEARLDYPDEELGDTLTQQLREDLGKAQEVIEELIASAAWGGRLMSGIRVVLFGPPNAGKSTLMNALLGEERAIVHSSAGTTRDMLEAKFELQGFSITLVDVAGVRFGDDVHDIEAVGVEKALAALERADLILALDPSDKPMGAKHPIYDWPNPQGRRILKIQSKADLVTEPTRQLDTLYDFKLSATDKNSLAELRSKMSAILELESNSSSALTSAHQEQELKHTQVALEQALQALDSAMPLEILSAEIRNAGYRFDRLTGDSLSEDVLNQVFTRFCLGK